MATAQYITPADATELIARHTAQAIARIQALSEPIEGDVYLLGDEDELYSLTDEEQAYLDVEDYDPAEELGEAIRDGLI